MFTWKYDWPRFFYTNNKPIWPFAFLKSKFPTLIVRGEKSTVISLGSFRRRTRGVSFRI